MPEIVAKNPINNAGSRPVKDHSTFDNTQPVAGTYRFGEYGVHFACDVVPDDEHTLRCKHVVRSYTLKAPMLQGLKLKKDYFLVPLSAILPLNYEKFIITPNIGDDINASEVGTSVEGFTDLIQNLFTWFNTTFNTKITEDEAFTADTLEKYIKTLLVADMLIGSGSLPSAMNCHLTSREFATSWDACFDAFFNRLWNHYCVGANGTKLVFKIGDLYYDVNTSNVGDIIVTNYHELMSMLRDDFSWSITSMTNAPFDDGNGAWDYVISPASFLSGDSRAPIDLAKFFAYQMICAHFYSNDHVDYIYSAELYRQNVYALLFNTTDGLITDLASESSDSYNFEWNGVSYRFDTLSSKFFHEALILFDSEHHDDSFDGLDRLYDYLRLIFGYNRSLRFQDYFTGSRTRPLAVGDAGVAVNDGYVNVVDTMQKRWYIKLWNQVNRVGRRMANQMKGLFPNVQTSTDWHDPIWLASTEDWVNASEVDNTGNAQIGDDAVNIPVTSSFIDKAEKYAFNINVNDRFGVVIGITSFDLQRFYGSSIDRSFFHVDRYDKFNPFLQFTGDQKVYQKELYSLSGFTNIFGYQAKHH